MPMPLFTNEIVVRGNFMYPGNAVVFTTAKVNAGLVQNEVFEVQDGEKEPQLYSVVHVKKVSLGWYEIQGTKILPP